MTRILGLGCFGALLCLAAGLFDAEALWVPGAGLVLLALLLGPGLLLAARGAQVERRLERSRVTEGEPLEVTVRARAGRLGLARGEVHLGDGGPPVARFGPGRGGARGRRQLRWERRGRHVLAPPELVLGDLLSLARRRVTGAGGDSVLVLPRLEPVRAAAGGLARMLGAEGAGPAGGAESEQDGLRPYRPGTPAARIHWPALARGAGLVERRLRPEADALPLVALDPGGDVPAEALDAAVRAAASLAYALARAGGCALLLPGERRATVLDPGLAAWPAAHARLAVVAPGAPLALGPRHGRHRTVLWVAPAARRLPTPAGAGASFLVVPGEGPGTPVFEVAGCRAYRTGGRAEVRAA